MAKPISWEGPADVGMGAVDPRLKCLAAVSGLLINLLAFSPVVPALSGGMAITLALSQGARPLTLAKRLLVPSYLALVVVGTQVLLIGHTPLLTLGPLTLFAEGLANGVLLASRMVSGAAIVLAFSLLTPVADVLALTAWLRLPPILVEVATLMFRYAFLLAEEAERLREAQTQRLGHSSFWLGLRSYGTLCGTLVVRCYDRSTAVYEAMVARGYDGRIRFERRPFGQREWLGAFGVSLVAVIGLLLGQV